MEGDNLLEESDEPKEYEEKDKKTRNYWQRWIKAAKKGADQHWKDAKAAWAEYEHQPDKDEPIRTGPKTASYPIYWSSVKTIEPAYYACMPKIRASRKFGINDPIAQTASKAAQRLAEHLVREADFDSVMMAAVADFIHADKTTTQVVYTADVQEDWQPDPVTMAPVLMGKVATNKKISCAPVCYDEILHSPEAKSWSEVKEIAYFFSMTEEEAEERFGEEKCKDIKWKLSKTYGEERDIEREEIPGKIVEGWEIHCKENKRVYWYSDQYDADLLDVKGDINELRGFFPSPPFIIGSKPSKSLYPTPAFIHVRDNIRSLHEQAFKVYELMKAIRRRALVDGTDPELIAALQEAGDNEFIAAKNLSGLVEKGGLQNVIQYIPVQELVAAIGELEALEEKFKQNFYEWFGVPDILRGTSDPVETAAAQEIKSGSAHDRFKYQKKQVAQLARDTIEMMVDLALGVLSEMEIAEIVGLQYMDPEDQQRFPEAIALLKNDTARMIRIEIDTDSLSFYDKKLKQAQATEAVQTVVTGLQTIAQMAAGDPTMLPVGLKTLLVGLEHLEMGPEFSDQIKGIVEQLIEEKQNPPEAPPPPDYEKMKLDLEAQRLQLESQKAGTEAEARARELQLQEAKLQLEGAKITSEAEIKTMKAAMDQEIQKLYAALDASRVQIEEFKAQMIARESEMEEIRLAKESDLEALKVVTGAGEGKREESPAPAPLIVESPPITINL